MVLHSFADYCRRCLVIFYRFGGSILCTRIVSKGLITYTYSMYSSECVVNSYKFIYHENLGVMEIQEFCAFVILKNKQFCLI